MPLTTAVTASIALVLIIFIIVRDLKNVRYVKVKIKNYTVKAEIADTMIKKMKGLMGRTGLKGNEGMLFTFNGEGRYRFWMMNMSIPIDIIFIDRKKTVVDMWKDAQPCRFLCSSHAPKKQCMYVLEVKADFTDRHGIETGSKIYFDLEKTY